MVDELDDGTWFLGVMVEDEEDMVDCGNCLTPTGVRN